MPPKSYIGHFMITNRVLGFNFEPNLTCIVLNNSKDLLIEFLCDKNILSYIINESLKSGMSLSMKRSFIQEILVAIIT